MSTSKLMPTFNIACDFGVELPLLDMRIGNVIHDGVRICLHSDPKSSLHDGQSHANYDVLITNDADLCAIPYRLISYRLPNYDRASQLIGHAMRSNEELVGLFYIPTIIGVDEYCKEVLENHTPHLVYLYSNLQNVGVIRTDNNAEKFDGIVEDIKVNNCDSGSYKLKCIEEDVRMDTGFSRINKDMNVGNTAIALLPKTPVTRVSLVITEIDNLVFYIDSDDENIRKEIMSKMPLVHKLFSQFVSPLCSVNLIYTDNVFVLEHVTNHPHSSINIMLKKKLQKEFMISLMKHVVG